jgi:hypothetical protein
MKRFPALLPVFLLLACNLYSQNTEYEYLLNKNQFKKATKGVKLYCGLTHQHQSFFNKPFSLTGIEAGIISGRNILLGVYGSSFLSNLEIENSVSKTYFSSMQGGLAIGVLHHGNKWLHEGVLLNAGYFSITGSSSNFQLFAIQNSTAIIHGLVITPMAFAEINVLRWMKFRTGLGYSFYNFKDQSSVSVSDLQNVSINFGFLFGKYL